MSGDYLFQVNGVIIGRVLRFDAHEPSHRWIGIARRKSWRDPENRKGFRTKREARAWVEAEAKKLNYEYD